MKTKTIVPALIIGLSACAMAQGPEGPPPPDPIARTLDKNRDGELSAREIKNAERQLLKLDQDRDDALSEEELKPEPPQGRDKPDNNQNPPPAPPPSELMAAIDTDGDGALSEAEIKVAATSIAALDKDSNGEIDNTEAQSLRIPDEEMQGGGGGGGMGPPPGGGGRPPGPPPGGGR
ncbi:MAG: hypothetical protein ABJQ29_04045 [Luteolibacter sp.]